MAETYFDVNLGELLVGDAAIEQRAEQSGPGEIVPLGTLLTSRQFPFDSKSFPKADTLEWQPDDYRSYGKWLLTITTHDGESLPITQKILRRLYILGLGPEQKRLTERVGFTSLTHFKREIDAPLNRTPNLYKDWEFGKFIDYGFLAEELCGGKPTTEDYDRLARAGHGPSSEYMKIHIGGISKIDEFLGYPNTLLWEDGDYIRWGVQVMEANDGRLDYTFPLILGPRKRGPSSRSIRKYFGSWESFQTTVNHAYELKQKENVSQRDSKLKDYKQLVLARQLPYTFRYLSDDELLDHGAKYELAKRLLPDAWEDELYAISTTSTDALLPALQAHKSQLNIYTLETTAQAMNIHSYIQTSQRYMQYLRVTAADIRTLLDEHARARREKLKLTA